MCKGRSPEGKHNSDAPHLGKEGTGLGREGTGLGREGTDLCREGTDLCTEGTDLCREGTGLNREGTDLCREGTAYRRSLRAPIHQLPGACPAKQAAGTTRKQRSIRVHSCPVDMDMPVMPTSCRCCEGNNSRQVVQKGSWLISCRPEAHVHFVLCCVRAVHQAATTQRK